MSQGTNVAPEVVEELPPNPTSVRIKKSLSSRARHYLADRPDISFQQLVNEGLELRLDEIDGKVTITRIESEPNAAN